MSFERFFLAVLVGSAVIAPSASAEDIDLFLGKPNVNMRANVLIVLDSGANWASQVDDTWSSSVDLGGGKSCGTGGAYFCYAKSALVSVLNSLGNVNNFKVGLMMNSLPNNGGGYVRYAMRDMGNTANRDALIQLLKGLSNNTLISYNEEPLWQARNLFAAALSAFVRPAYAAAGGNYSDKGSNTDMSWMLNEAYRYFTGKSAVMSGNQAMLLSSSDKDNDVRDYGTIRYLEYNAAGKQSVVPQSMGDTGAYIGAGSTTYQGVTGEEGCANNFILYIGNGKSSGSSESAANDFFKSNYSGYAPLAAPAFAGYYGDSFARFMNSGSEEIRIKTYTIDIAPETTGQGPANTALLKNMAKLGGGTYSTANNTEELIASIKKIFNQIMAVNSVYASVALPVSVNVRGTHLNQVYMGVFRPETKPRWFGNLKLNQLALDPNDSDNVLLVDSTGTTQLQSPTTGFIVDEATSFWTHSSAFWNYRCADGNGNPLAYTQELAILCGNPISGSDSPDGATVEKGSAGQMLREAFTADASNSGRKLYTCWPSCNSGDALSGKPFNTTTIDPNAAAAQTAFGVSDAGYTNANTSSTGVAGELKDIVNWVRGVDNTSPPENSNTVNQARPSMPGDVLHSRPVIVNYNSTAADCKDSANSDKDVMAFYGGNDGILHAVKGGKNDITDAGKELWGFVPTEFFGGFKRLRDNTTEVKFPAPVPAGENNKPYMIDGNITIYSRDANKDCKLTPGTEDKVYLFMAMRRGGRFIYALDVTDKNNPKFLWKKSNADSGYSELGQTWSQLTPAELADGKPVVIFGAGYDPNADDRPYNCDINTGVCSYGPPPSLSRTMGRGVFIVNAETGAVIRQFGCISSSCSPSNMTYSIPSDVAVLKEQTANGYAMMAYVGDTGGNVWKIDFRDPDTKQPTADEDKWKATQLASLGDPADTGRTTLNARRFLFPPDVVKLREDVYAILLGSGDREKPFDTTVDAAVRNRFYMIKDSDSISYPVKCEGNESTCGLYNATSNGSVPSSANGWYIELPGIGEKTVGGAVTVSGTTFFPTNIPPADSNSCSLSLGTAYMYGVSYQNGTASFFTNGNGEMTRTKEVPGGGFPPTPMPVAVDLDGKVYVDIISGAGSHTINTIVPNRRSAAYRYKERLD
jgi:type IV pilus assembly protein PilY1